MLYPPAQFEEYKDGTYQMKTFDANFDLMCIHKKYKNGNEDVSYVKDDSYKEEEYKIEINEKGVTITHSGECSIFRALTSLKQLIKKTKGKLPYCEIKDFPDFQERGFMLDISRGKIPKVEGITRWIDLICELKYNQFQLYVEHFVIKYKAFPQCTEGFDCLTTDDLEYLDRYCKERFIKFVPNQNGLGHMKSWLSREEFKHLKIGYNGDYPSGTLNPLLPESFEFIEKIYDSLLPHFSADTVNVGLDEAHELDKYELEDVCKKEGKDTVFMDWLCKISNLAGEKYNKKIQFWADMLYKFPEAFKRVPKGATALVWAYDLLPTTRYEERCRSISENGCEFYVCPGDQTWKSITGRFDTMAINTRIAADIGKKYGAKGYLFTNWGNGGNMQFPLWSYVPVALAALYSWKTGEYSHYLTKTENVKMAEKYVDNEMFGGAPVSELLHRLQRYYLLEPELCHDRTIAFSSLFTSIDKGLKIGSFDADNLCDNFYFDNVIDYVEKALKDVDSLDIDEDIKDQIKCNAKTVVFSQELHKIRKNKNQTEEKLDEITELADFILKTFDRLWKKENFTTGKEIFMDEINARCAEIKTLKYNLQINRKEM